MNRTPVFLYLSTILVFVIIYFLNQGFIEVFCVKNPTFVWQFYYFISGVSALMLMNLVLVHYLHKKYVGYTFLAWTMIKLMLVMGYFLVFVFQPKITLSNNVLYTIVSLYLVYLIYEVFFAVLLMRKS